MPSADEARAAELLERLLTDGEFRASFRRNPASACAAFDLQDLAREFGAGGTGGKSLHTLEIRESRSSLAGALMAAASEGSSGVESLRRMHEGSGLSNDAHRVVHKALTSPKLQAVSDPSLHAGVGVHENLVHGGAVSATGGAIHEASAQSVSSVLDNHQLTLSPEAHAALVRGGADQRLVDVLDTLSRDHQLRIGTLQVTHGAGGDSLDILSVDGQRVSQSNIAARDLANELASLDPSVRPAHIVTPWPIAGDGFTTTGGHDDRIHIVFAAPEADGSSPAVEQSVGAAPAAASPATNPIDTSSPSADTSTSSDTTTPSTPPPDPSTQPSGGAPTTPPPDPTTQPSGGGAPTTPPPDPTTQPSSGAPTTPPPDPTTQPSSGGAPTTPPPPDPSTQPTGGSTPTTPPPDPTTQPSSGGAPTTPPPPDPSTQPTGGSTPTTPPPDPTTQPSSGGGTQPPEPTTTPPEPSTPQAGGHAADTGTPAGTSAPQAAPPTTPPPSPTTPPVTPGTPAPVAPGTVPEVSHQSIQLAAVGGTPPSHSSTLQFDVPQHQGGGGGDPRELLGSGGTGAGAFDPNAAGGLPDASDTYPGDNAGQAAIAAWMARQAHAAGLPAELPIMAALTESGLKNDNYGDRDSLGFFQMRTSIWNQGEYAGFPDHPELQLKWFINQALAVRSKEISEGNTTFGQDKNGWGDWVADVEQPAAEYRGRYQTHLDQADGLLGAGSPSAPAALPGAAGSTTDPSQFSEALQAGASQTGYSTAGLQALMIAEKYIGTPYHWGGDTPATGFDCSGLVEYSYAQLGIHVPRVAADQFNVGIPVTKDELKPGDIVFFKDSTGYVHHEGIYIGNDMFLHAPHTGDVVKISSLDDTYYAQQFAGGRDVSGLASTGAPPGAEVPPASFAPPSPPEAPAAPAAPAGDNESGLFGAVGGSGSGGSGSGSDPPVDPSPAGPPGSGSTVQIFPAIKDPSDPPASG